MLCFGAVVSCDSSTIGWVLWRKHADTVVLRELHIAYCRGVLRLGLGPKGALTVVRYQVCTLGYPGTKKWL